MDQMAIGILIGGLCGIGGCVIGSLFAILATRKDR